MIDDLKMRSTSAPKLTDKTTNLEVRIRHGVTRRAGRPSIENRRIDYKAYTIEKIIRDAETREVVYQQARHDLRDHQGRGSAKKKKKKS